MTLKRRRLGIGWQVSFWLAAAAITVFLLWLFSAVLLPFVMAIAIGYLLDPLVDKMERMGIGRAIATSIILVGTLVVFVLVVALIAPMLGRQISDFVKAFPDLVQKAQGLISSTSDSLSNGRINALLTKLGLGDSGVSEIKNTATDVVNKAVNWVVGFGNSLLYRGAALLDLISLLVVTPVVAFYMLVDWPKMVKSIDGLVPPRNRDTVRMLAREINEALAGFLRGQSLVCLFLAAWYGIGLSLIGVNFGFLIGIVGGLLSFVPYVGSLLVLVLSLLIATVQGWPSWHLPAAALGVVMVGQFLEGNVLSPKLVGDKVGLHPVWVMFALLAFGSVWGFTGLIVAVPVSSAIGVLLRFAAKRYRESPMFTGELPPLEPASVPAIPKTPPAAAITEPASSTPARLA